MEHPLSPRTIGRTAVVAGFLVALAVAGRPIPLAVLMGLLLVGVWAAPLVLAPARHRAAAPIVVPVVDPEEPGTV